VKDSCFIIKGNPGGGGNAAFGALQERDNFAGSPIILRRTAAIGDSLCATVVADNLIRQGYRVTMQTHPHCQCVVKLHPGLAGVESPQGFCHINLDGAYEKDPNRTKKHFHQMFFEKANQQLLSRGISLGDPLNCKPAICVPKAVRDVNSILFEQWPRPWVFVCPRSDFYKVRTVPDWIWERAATKINGTKFWIARHPAPKNFIDLKAVHFESVIQWLTAADLLVTVDTGPMHVAAALGIPMVVISQSSSPELHLNDQNDFISIAPKLDCLNCQKNICPIADNLPPCQTIDPEFIAQWANARLRSKFSEDVSAIVPIYQPDVNVLNRCLQCVLPQVSEVIVTGEGYSRVPDGALQHPKIRYVQKPDCRIGYGRNTNFGARHSNGKYLLTLNDDVFLDPDAVEKMKQEMKSDVGMVAHLLRYPDGRIYHAGVDRKPGMKDWYHIDHLQLDATFQQVTELENVCGTSVMIRRDVFFGIDGFDEEFFLYSEDNDLAMRVRRAGWKIMYTPFATGIHLGHQSSNKIGGAGKFIADSNRLFHKKWEPYLRHNLNKVPGDFSYLTAK
jgi:GT2 family glycosyltransferase